MKLFLILEYKKDTQGNVWAEVRAFASKKMREAEWSKYHIPGAINDKDVETQDIEVIKRPYMKRAING